MLRFILNNQLVETSLPSGSTVLDFIRYHKRLTGTKTGCREGDCGACTILVGEWINGDLQYRSMTSCLMPLGNAHGKHLVSVEGINMPGSPRELSPVQKAMLDTNGTQCGFCTIGFVMSLTGFVLDHDAKDYDSAIRSIDGNICRCTGYKSIERAAGLIADQIAQKPKEDTLNWLVGNNFIPEYFTGIKERLKKIQQQDAGSEASPADLIVAGGTDLLVQKPLAVKKSTPRHVFDSNRLRGIVFENGQCRMGASVTVTDFVESGEMKKIFPGLEKYVKWISSTPIRNMATIAGNIVNASPIGDMSAFLLALDSELHLNRNGKVRTVPLKNFFKAYKQTDKAADEIIESIVFSVPEKAHFNFEKVCKREHLDIASVNSACLISLDDDGIILNMHLSAGGVAPFPKYLFKTVEYLKGKKISKETISTATAVMNEEIAPISDARGTETYKRFLLRQLFLAHILKFSGHKEEIKELLLEKQI